MKLVMTLLVRDEQDILATNIEYHLSQGVDFIIATDNLSSDNTTDILKTYEKQGVLHYINEADDNYAQARWVTRMVHLAVDQYQADWIINNDADEFWWVEQGTNLKDFLTSQAPAVKALEVTRYNFIPTPESANHWFIDTMTLREKQSFNAIGNPLPPKVCHRAMPQLEIAQGNHAVMQHGQALNATPSRDMSIFHFPLRTYQQFENKIKKGGAAYARNTELAPQIGITWRKLYETYQAGLLREEVERCFMSDAEIEKKLSNAELLPDTRLKEYLHKYSDIKQIKARSHTYRSPWQRLFAAFRR